ncbi:hypothetical protein [Allokutzneria oryzae]|uniref:Uncharacterized protein n=1 Tax=Allokutzneria oryzae TaxID=1378989 RepID=A0ABV5ZTG9_9PSEU
MALAAVNRVHPRLLGELSFADAATALGIAGSSVRAVLPEEPRVRCSPR